jgi:hypothetical protein
MIFSEFSPWSRGLALGVGQEGPLDRELAQMALKRKLQQELEKTKKANEEILGQKKAFGVTLCMMM